MSGHALAEVGTLKNSPDPRRPQRYASCRCGAVVVQIYESGEGGVRQAFARHLANPEIAQGAGVDAYGEPTHG